MKHSSTTVMNTSNISQYLRTTPGCIEHTCCSDIRSSWSFRCKSTIHNICPSEMSRCTSFHFQPISAILLLLIILLLTAPGNISAQDSGTAIIEAETGAVWFSRNDVRIPNEGGTKFDMIDLIGKGPSAYFRIRIGYHFSDRHYVRGLFAPLEVSGTAELDRDVFFNETTFASTTPTKGTYRFSTYRLTYRYTFYRTAPWTLGVGAAGLVRDAKIELEQNPIENGGDISDRDTDLGFVPLIHFMAKRDVSNRIAVTLDLETLGSLQGRATDLSLMMDYNVSDAVVLSAGYRLLEGGADVDQVYNFSWINYAVTGFSIRL